MASYYDELENDLQTRKAEGKLTPTEQYLLDKIDYSVRELREKDKSLTTANAEIERLWTARRGASACFTREPG